MLESEPMAALAQAFTYREIHLLQRINEAVRAVLKVTPWGRISIRSRVILTLNVC
ncbi:MAG: hypothetical protein ACLR17_00425 [Enterobacteriaceae bacterium]